MTKESAKRIINFVLMTVGCVLIAAGVYFFKVPNGFATGGVSGIGTLLAKLTTLSAGVWIWILNGACLVLGLLFLGKSNTVKTIYCSMLYSALTVLFEKVLPFEGTLSDEPLLELVYAMLLTSIGAAMIFNSDSSSGGTDILALILKKYSSIDVGKALLAVDFVIALSSFYVFGIRAGLFSILGLFSKAFIVDAVIENLNTCKYFIVITDKKDEVRDFIIKNLHHGVTSHKVIGEFTGEERTMIHTVCKRIEAIKLRNEIRKMDPHAFMIITTSSEIIGRGFRSI